MDISHTGQNQFECRRCGTCCRKGGPALHDADARLVAQKSIPPADLYTIRAGERVRDNINGGLIYTDAEIIKIRSVPASAACLFFRDSENACGIYDHRPSECRAMQCRDTTAIVGMHARNRLCRKDLFGDIGWLWEIIEAHESECGFEKINRLIEQRRGGDFSASRQLSERIAYDRAIRDLSVEKAGLGKGMLDLVFGLPLERVLQDRYGVKIRKNDPF
ncbi:MAG: YkgJ family cysteine cluster protein [Desulfosalsimonadaceae bacterium]